MLSGVDPQLENDVGETVILIISGWLEETSRVTGETDGLQVKESGALPEKECTTDDHCDQNNGGKQNSHTVNGCHTRQSSWRIRELRLFHYGKQGRTVDNPVMLQIYRDNLQRVRHHDRLASAQVDAAFTQNQVCRKPKAVQNARANRLDACWDYPPVVGQGHLCVVTATSTTRLCFRQV